MKQIAAFLATSAGAAVSSLCCANNPGMVGELDRYGDLKTPDVHAEVFKQLTDSLKISKVTEVDFSSCGIGPVALGHLSEWVRDAIGAIARLTLSGNMITGSRQEWDDDVEDEVWIYDKDLSGLASLCDAFLTLKTPIELDLSNCGLSVNGVNPLAKAISAGGAVTSINCLANKFGEEDLATLLTAIEGTSVRSLCGLAEGQTTADFSGQNLGPIDMKIMAAEYGFQGLSARSTR